MNGSWSHRAAKRSVIDKRASCQKDSLLRKREGKVGVVKKRVKDLGRAMRFILLALR